MARWLLLRSFDIQPIGNTGLRGAAELRWNSLTKPPGSLGRLEELVTTIALQQGKLRPSLGVKSLYVFCGDHGIAAEGVSAYPSEVTRQMALNFVAGGAAINVLCRRIGIRTVIVDAGVKGESVPGAVALRIGEGTRNFRHEPAMSRNEAERAIEAGTELAASAGADGIRGVGEMGIGNTTSASALLCAFTGVSPRDAVGPGTGVTPSGVARKAEVIEGALALHRPDASDPIGVLSQLGGYEIATMTGFLLASAERRIPVMMDGFISCAAALAAHRLAPTVLEYLLFSHRSAEPAHARMLAGLNATPLLDLSLRLGEGTGAALGISLAEHALALYDGMATFAEAAVSNK
jgi:nicotinate-nucleotide--dimethylbenzimidazole phosphoribosyltransferase